MLRDKENQLQKRLQEINDSSNKPQWKKYNAQMVNFPILSEDDVKNLCFSNVSVMSRHLRVDTLSYFSLLLCGRYMRSSVFLMSDIS